jgi:hypothetical protein
MSIKRKIMISLTDPPKVVTFGIGLAILFLSIFFVSMDANALMKTTVEACRFTEGGCSEGGGGASGGPGLPDPEGAGGYGNGTGNNGGFGSDPGDFGSNDGGFGNQTRDTGGSNDGGFGSGTYGSTGGGTSGPASEDPNGGDPPVCKTKPSLPQCN